MCPLRDLSFRHQHEANITAIGHCVECSYSYANNHKVEIQAAPAAPHLSYVRDADL